MKVLKLSAAVLSLLLSGQAMAQEESPLLKESLKDVKQLEETALQEHRDGILTANFNVGQATLKGLGGSAPEAQGLAFGFRLDFWKTLGVGLETQSMRVGRTQIAGGGPVTAESGAIYLLPEAHANIIRYGMGPADLNVAISVGSVLGSAVGSESDPLFFGGSFDLSYQKKIGLRLDLRNGASLGSLNTFSLVGYY